MNDPLATVQSRTARLLEDILWGRRGDDYGLDPVRIAQALTDAGLLRPDTDQPENQ